jgi:hypothetical protein
VYALFGLDLIPMKALIVLFFVGALALVAALTRDALGSFERAGLVLIVGLNPFFWDFKDAILSDIPFLFFACLGLLVAMRLVDPRAAMPSLRQALVLGCLLYVAYATRTAGIALVISVAAAEILVRRQVRRPIVVALAAFGVLAAAQEFFVPGVNGYLQQLSLDPRGLQPQVVGNISALAGGFASMWTASSMTPIGAVLAVGGSALVLRGYLARLRCGWSVLQVFPLVYLAVIVAWPRGTELRFLIPVIPFTVYFGWVGLRSLPLPASATVSAMRSWAGAALVTAVLLAYGLRYATLDRGPIRQGLDAPDTQSLFQFVRDQTNPGEIVVFRRPRALALYTGRSAGPYAPGPGRLDVLAYLHSVRPALVISAPQDRKFWSAVADGNPALLEAVYRNPTYVAYRVRE